MDTTSFFTQFLESVVDIWIRVLDVMQSIHLFGTDLLSLFVFAFLASMALPVVFTLVKSRSTKNGQSERRK